jgi:hypothetical protein
MTREQVAQIIGDVVTEDMINAILNANSADIGRAKQSTDALNQTIAELNAQLETARATISTLEGNAANAEAINAELEKYRTAERERTEAETRAQAEAKMRSRFDAVVADKKFVNDLTRDGIFAQFKTALKDAANMGKGDAAVLADLLEGKADLLANPNPAVNIPGAAPLNNQQLTVEAFKAMPLAQQMQWANTNPEMYSRMSDMLKAKKG